VQGLRLLAPNQKGFAAIAVEADPMESNSKAIWNTSENGAEELRQYMIRTQYKAPKVSHNPAGLIIA